MRLLTFEKELCGIELNASSIIMLELLNYHFPPDIDGLPSLSFLKGRS